MSNILVLGGAGFLGANIVHHLVGVGHKVTVIDRSDAALSRLTSLTDRITLYKTPLTNLDEIRRIIEVEGIDTVTHLVSTLLPSSSFADYIDEYEKIILPTLKLIHLLSELRLRLVFLSSGGTVYGIGTTGIFKESDPCAPINYYGQCKKIIEEYILFANRKYGLDYLILRPSNPYGRFQSLRSNQGFISVVFGRIINDEPIEIWGDGSVVRDYIYIEDFVNVLAQLIENKVSNMTLNVGTGTGHTLIEVINAIEAVTGKSVNLNFKAARNVDVPTMILDISALTAEINYKFNRLEDGLQSYYRLLKDNNA
jgi:UDP-glucose 4-epimerase